MLQAHAREHSLKCSRHRARATWFANSWLPAIKCKVYLLPLMV